MKRGFTLAELLIALAILGVIATFTIPKVLNGQQDRRFNAIAKETAGMISGAYSTYKQNTTPSTAMTPSELTPFMNYVVYDTTSSLDHVQLAGMISIQCSSTEPCILLHNGARIRFENRSFSGTATNNCVWMFLDPDGKVTDGTNNGPGRSVEFALYYNGRLTTLANLLPNCDDSGGSWASVPTADPLWFSWDN